MPERGDSPYPEMSVQKSRMSKLLNVTNQLRDERIQKNSCELNVRPLKSSAGS
jgi:hypothetical protein